MTIEVWLPESHVRSRHHVDVAASQHATYRAMRGVDLRDSMLIRALLTVRGLRSVATIDSFIEAGFVLLADEPPDGLVLGLVGRFWRPDGPLRRVAREDFAEFDDPGFAKAAWAFTTHELSAGTRLTTETRVWCTDPGARRRFRAYWRVVGPFSGAIRTRMLRLAKQAAEARS